ncbi:MAG: thioredoxin fold domain-containing protein [Bacteroidota bacterium]
MKRIWTTFFFALLCSGLLKAQGIQFRKGQWKDILAEAKKSNKLVFLDAYTSWCGPCKQMSARIFTQPKVGSYFNDKFINVKLDMEKGEGPEVARAYRVMVYPTLLFVDGEGKLVHRAAGFKDVDQLIELGDIAMGSDKSLDAMAKRFEAGERSQDFLLEYTKACFEAQDGSHTKVAEAYMATQEDWTKEENMAFLFNYTGDAYSSLFDYLIKEQDQFAKVFGEAKVKGRIQEIIYQSVYDSADKSSLEQIDELFAKAYGDRAAELSAKFRLTFYRQAGDRAKYAESAVALLKDFPRQEAEELNEIAWTFYRVVEDKKLLKKAVKWTKKSIKQEDRYYNNDTLAALYFKLGKKKKATKTALKAIRLAKESGQDFTETDKMLEEIYKL